MVGRDPDFTHSNLRVDEASGEPFSIAGHASARHITANPGNIVLNKVLGERAPTVYGNNTAGREGYRGG